MHVCAGPVCLGSRVFVVRLHFSLELSNFGVHDVEVALGGLLYYLKLLYLPLELNFCSSRSVPFPLLPLTTFSPPSLTSAQPYPPSCSWYLPDLFLNIILLSILLCPFAPNLYGSCCCCLSF